MEASSARWESPARLSNPRRSITDHISVIICREITVTRAPTLGAKLLRVPWRGKRTRCIKSQQPRRASVLPFPPYVVIVTDAIVRVFSGEFSASATSHPARRRRAAHRNGTVPRRLPFRANKLRLITSTLSRYIEQTAAIRRRSWAMMRRKIRARIRGRADLEVQQLFIEATLAPF